jgi:tRNA A37 threonylcarbamoyladenosine synthetase subunit TsaC/SUA5/YrdC
MPEKLPAELLRVDAQSPEVGLLRYAAEFLTRGSVIAIPTDTFYGLAADPFNLKAVEEIYRVKGRPEARALPILMNSIEQAVSLTRGTPR